MCSCSGNKNQTQPETFKVFESKSSDSEYLRKNNGTGIFLVPAPELGILEVRKIIVEDLSYIETCKRGQNCINFSFIPHEIISGAEIKEKICKGYCPSSTCAIGGGCACYNYECI